MAGGKAAGKGGDTVGGYPDEKPSAGDPDRRQDWPIDRGHCQKILQG